MADIHRRKHLVLLGGLGERVEDLKWGGIQRWVALWIHELEEELKCLCGLQEVYNLSRGVGDVGGREPFGAHFKILAMDVEQNTVRGFEFDVCVGKVDCGGLLARDSKSRDIATHTLGRPLGCLELP